MGLRLGFKELHRVALACLGLALAIRYPIKFSFEAPFLMDFNVYYLTAKRVLAGAGTQLYTLIGSDDMYFKYGPIWALLWAPIGWMPPQPAAVLWTALNVAWLLATAWWANRILARAHLPAPWWAPVAATLLLVRPLGEEFGNGQANLWWAGLVTLSLYRTLSGQPWRAALALALAILLKLPAAIFLLYALWARQWASLFRTVTWLIVIALLGAFGIDSHHPGRILADWMQCLVTTTGGVALRVGDQSLNALFARFLTADGYGLNVLTLTPRDVFMVTAAADLLLLSAVAIPSPSTRAHPPRLVIDTALLMILMVLASPAAWLATYDALFFPAMVSLTLVRDSMHRRHIPVASGLCAAAAGLCSALTHKTLWRALGVLSWKSEEYIYLVLMILPLFGLSLWGLLWHQRAMAIRGWLTKFPAAAGVRGTSRS
jgi:hypothetical protein